MRLNNIYYIKKRGILFAVSILQSKAHSLEILQRFRNNMILNFT